MQRYKEIWKIVLIYFLFGSCWIIFSDGILQWIVPEPSDFSRWSILKGLAFVTVTSGLLFFLIAQYNKKINNSVIALRESEKRFHFLVENSSDCLVIINADGKQKYVSHGAELLFGFPVPELEGKKINEIVHPDDLPSVMNAWERCVKNLGSTVDVQYRHIHKEGGWVDCEAIARNFLNDPEIAGVIASVRDVTKRIRSEKTLKERNQFIITVLDNLPIGLSVNHINMGTAIYMNKKFEEIYGWPKEELKGLEDFFEKVFPDEKNRKKAKTKFEEDIQSGDPDRMTWEGIQVTNKNGKKKIVVAKNIPLFEQQLMISTVQDITERQKLQNQLSLSQRLESVGRLAGGVAHDLNNLLTPIMGFSEIILHGLSKEDKRFKNVKEILNAGLRARDLVGQLLAFSRKQVLEFKPIDINETISSFEKLLRRTIPEDIEIESILKPELPIVKADTGQIEQILMNLSVNAADAMPNGGKLIIETELAELDENYAEAKKGVQDGKYVMLVVSDNGSGMNSKITEQIFEPFYSTKGEQGTGLGLATVYGIVKQHGGNIWVCSEEGSGTTFKVYLPVFDKIILEEPQGEERQGEEQQSDLQGNETILIAEDNEQVRRLAKLVLKKLGYTILEAENGTDAAYVCASHNGPVNLLLTDVVMPGMNGRELYQNLVKGYPQIKVLYMSGYTSNIIVHRGVLEDGVQFIQKPFKNQVLAAKIREVLLS